MTRFCVGCKRTRPLREFNLDVGQRSTTCLDCLHGRALTEDTNTLAPLLAQLAAFEHERRVMIASFVKIDVKIAEIRAQLAESSTSFKRVEPREVFDDDSDLGFGD